MYQQFFIDSLLFLGFFPKHSVQAFKNEWVEVEVKQPIQYPKTIDFLTDSLSLPEPITYDSNWEGLLIFLQIHVLDKFYFSFFFL